MLSPAARADELFQASAADPLPAHRSLVRGPDGLPVARGDRRRAAGSPRARGPARRARRILTSGPRSSSAARSASSRSLLALTRPGRASTRHVIAVGQMLTSALLIHLTGGRIETHFHVFGSLAFLAVLPRLARPRLRHAWSSPLDHLLRGAALAAIGLRRAVRQRLALARARRLGDLRGHWPVLLKEDRATVRLRRRQTSRLTERSAGECTRSPPPITLPARRQVVPRLRVPVRELVDLRHWLSITQRRDYPEAYNGALVLR